MRISSCNVLFFHPAERLPPESAREMMGEGNGREDMGAVVLSRTGNNHRPHVFVMQQLYLIKNIFIVKYYKGFHTF